MSDEALKSSYELAMERLKAKDEQEGVLESKPLTAKHRSATNSCTTPQRR
jgi:hypothetical protein